MTKCHSNIGFKLKPNFYPKFLLSWKVSCHKICKKWGINQSGADIRNCTKPQLAIKKINTQLIKSNYLVIIYNHGSQIFLTKSNIHLNPPGLHRFFHENLAVLWSFWHTQSRQFFESDFFQIFRTDSSLILIFSKYLEPEGITKNQIPAPDWNLPLQQPCGNG